MQLIYSTANMYDMWVRKNMHEKHGVFRSLPLFHAHSHHQAPNTAPLEIPRQVPAPVTSPPFFEFLRRTGRPKSSTFAPQRLYHHNLTVTLPPGRLYPSQWHLRRPHTRADQSMPPVSLPPCAAFWATGIAQVMLFVFIIQTNAQCSRDLGAEKDSCIATATGTATGTATSSSKTATAEPTLLRSD